MYSSCQWRPHLRSPAAQRCPWTAHALTSSVLAEQRDAEPGSLPCWFWSGHGALSFAHGVTLQGQLVRVVDQPVKDGIGQGWLPNRLMPVLDRQLAGDDRGPAVMA